MIEAKELTKTIGGTAVLRGLHFRMKEGCMTGIIGPNGAGKSTLIRIISGVDAPTSGVLALDGRPAAEYPRRELAKRVAVLQQGGLAPVGFTVREVVRMGRFPYQSWLGEEKADATPIIEEALEAMGLAQLQNRRFDQLSGGERQRVALAKTMAQQPRLLLLDEPTTYLDIGYQVQMLDTVKSWQRRRGLTVVAVLHDLNLAAQYCDELFVLAEGRLAAAGTPSEIVTADMIRSVYGTEAIVLRHPATGVPQVLLQPSDFSDYERRDNEI